MPSPFLLMLVNWPQAHLHHYNDQLCEVALNIWLMSNRHQHAESGDGERLATMVRAFRERVDEELPGMYVWFDDSSLHITVRALMG